MCGWREGSGSNLSATNVQQTNKYQLQSEVLKRNLTNIIIQANSETFECDCRKVGKLQIVIPRRDGEKQRNLQSRIFMAIKWLFPCLKDDFRILILDSTLM